MAAVKKVFFCKSCGFESAKWLGQCPGCHEWNSFVEEPKVSRSDKGSAKGYSNSSSAVLLSSINADNAGIRILSDIKELDRVLGGGIVEGSLILLGGEPGIGKSTLVMQACINLSRKYKILYVSGEESSSQIKLRADRLGGAEGDFLLLCDSSLDNAMSIVAKERPGVVIIDSIQTMQVSDMSSAAGSVSSVREATSIILRASKEYNISFLIIGHVTKEGMVAGPRVLEHMVDTVLYFEGENTGAYRILRGVKNRFGATHEIGVFEMSDKGLIEVDNPSRLMINQGSNNSGCVISCTVEGSRSILVELQALIAESIFQLPRRTSYGIDYNRVNLLLAVLEKRAGLKLMNCDAYVNVTGGLKVNEPAIDLAITAAIISSYRGVPMPSKTVVFGEIGLSGEVRAVSRAAARISEAVNLGFERVIMPQANYDDVKDINSIEKIFVRNIEDMPNLIK